MDGLTDSPFSQLYFFSVLYPEWSQWAKYLSLSAGGSWRVLKISVHTFLLLTLQNKTKQHKLSNIAVSGRDDGKQSVILHSPTPPYSWIDSVCHTVLHRLPPKSCVWVLFGIPRSNRIVDKLEGTWRNQVTYSGFFLRFSCTLVPCVND